MLNQQDMTETAKAVFNELSDKPATAGEIAQNTPEPRTLPAHTYAAGNGGVI
ncbi:hypothetical protein [Enterococcus faecalis]|uniref:hypothetical protein n=1 Tax=Enterococcus faecalis TaxID=1351 RepID=UPI001C8F2A64|nr:hypothetical protein [Enterococcus faecalis]